MKVISLLVIFVFLVAAQCCTVTPTPTVTDPADWSKRLKATDAALVADKTTVLNLKVDFQYNFDEYRFKVGADSATPCGTDTGYTPWTAKATRLQADISSAPDGKMKLCIVGRGKNNCNNVITQLPIQANFYRWNKDTTGPSAFSITGPTAPQTATTFTATWGAAAGAAGYTASIHSAAGCQTATMLSQYSSTGTTTNVTVSAAGSYFLCVNAADAIGNKTNAANNGMAVSVQGQEVIIEDRITDRSCWATGATEADQAYLHYSQIASNYPEVGSTFIGNGRPLKRVGVLFGQVAKANLDACDATDWNDFLLTVAIFQSKPDYISQPRTYTGRPGVFSVAIPQPSNNNPSSPNYYRNPVATDGYGCPIYYAEVDLEPLNVGFNTVQNQEGVVLLRPANGNVTDVWTYTYLGKNSCAGAIGNNPDLNVSLSGTNAGIPRPLPEFGAAHSHGVYRVSTN